MFATIPMMFLPESAVSDIYIYELSNNMFQFENFNSCKLILWFNWQLYG